MVSVRLGGRSHSWPVMPQQLKLTVPDWILSRSDDFQSFRRFAGASSSPCLETAKADIIFLLAVASKLASSQKNFFSFRFNGGAFSFFQKNSNFAIFMSK
jgi:hypothetical protein